jgi:hypothetical protein
MKYRTRLSLGLFLLPSLVIGQIPDHSTTSTSQPASLAASQPASQLAAQPSTEPASQPTIPEGLELGISGGDRAIHDKEGNLCGGYFPALPQHKITTTQEGTLRFWHDGGVNAAIFAEQGELVYCSQVETCSGEGCEPPPRDFMIESPVLPVGSYRLYIGSDRLENSYLYVLDSTSVYGVIKGRRSLATRETIALWVEENNQQVKGKPNLKDSNLLLFPWQNVLPTFGNVISIGGRWGPDSFLLSGELSGKAKEALRFGTNTTECVGYLEIIPKIVLKVPRGTPAQKVLLELIGDEEDKKKVLLVRRLSDKQIKCFEPGSQEKLELELTPGLYEVYIGGLNQLLTDPYSLKISTTQNLSQKSEQEPNQNNYELVSSYKSKQGSFSNKKIDKKPKEKSKEKSKTYRPKTGEPFGSVIRLDRKDQLACTGTLVEWNKGFAILTAAHCLYTLQKGRFTNKSKSLKARGKGDEVIFLADALLSKSFSECAESKSLYEKCKDKGDTTLIPISQSVAEKLFGPTEGRPFAWQLATEPPVNSCTAVGFGHATASQRRPGAIPLTPQSGVLLWSSSENKEHALPGDSGAPVLQDKNLLSRYSKNKYDTEPKTIYFVLTGYQTENQNKTTLMSPVWDLQGLLAR